MPKRSIYLSWIISALVLLLGSYWIKCHAGINLLDSVSLSSYFPFRLLKKPTLIDAPHPGVLLADSFESFRIFSPWSRHLWAHEKGKVSIEYGINDRDNSRCLLIRNLGKKSWSYSQDQRIAVHEGDIFYFKGIAKIPGNGSEAELRVAAFDSADKNISWSYANREIKEAGTWIAVETKFTVTKGVSSIVFGLSGSGKGAFLFDDIEFGKAGHHSSISPNPASSNTHV